MGARRMMTNYSKDLRFRMPVEQKRKNRGGVNAYVPFFLRPHDRDRSIVRSFFVKIWMVVRIQTTNNKQRANRFKKNTHNPKECPT